jgi:GNAT superfamily N-acetyltransferase
MSAVAVRERGPGDEHAIRRLRAESLAAGPPERCTVFVAELDGHPAGYAAIAVDHSRVVVEQLVVAPADRGRHVGNALLDWVEGYGVNRGVQRVVVAATGIDRRAADFYARRGYVTSGAVLERELVHA